MTTPMILVGVLVTIGLACATTGLASAEEADPLSNDIPSLNLEQKRLIERIIQQQKTVDQVRREIAQLEDRMDSHLGPEHYGKTIGALERAAKGQATASDKDYLDTFVIGYADSNEIASELKDQRGQQQVEQNEAAELGNLQEKLVQEEKYLKEYESSLSQVGAKIDGLLANANQENEFRLMMSWAFSILVALVIAGFYFIVIKRDDITSDIFSGEKGIQFITLFLIIIAVILFGIMGILESRELSALLGALSGYILGRTSGAREPRIPPG